ncbi:serum response factor homolog [Tachypleus tridentatus]|uniref:serum response factor homolog n=1 Tax=Tachypleus tridentatus TaxID=6853 RepID=UPI003FD0BCD1
MQRISSIVQETSHPGLMLENIGSLTQGFSGDSEEDSREGNSNGPGGQKRNAEEAGFTERSGIDVGSTSDKLKKTIPPNGKKTKGRVKIKMEFIDNKLRRYTTFSKRKTGIMKKAYELSTLTGTQVMLLVASETGHVYTFATRKLQPMITSDAGKALIQTCLNSPDALAGPGVSGLDQRMSATGFEETELVYSVNEDTENRVSHYQPHMYAQVPEYNTQKLPPFYTI